MPSPMHSAAAAEATPADAHHADPLNAMLDLAEAAIRTVLDQGCEPQLRARLARLLPPPPAPPVPEPEPEPAPLRAGAGLSATLDSDALARELAGLRSIETRRLSDVERDALGLARARVSGMLVLVLAAARHGRANA